MNWFEKDPEFFLSEQIFIKENYPELHYRKRNGVLYLKGHFNFLANYNDVQIDDTYEIEIRFPLDYPETPPVINEIGEKIPKEYHHYDSGELCLGAVVANFLEFRKRRQLKDL